jgi:hypothetical protein
MADYQHKNENNTNQADENRFLALGFFEFAIISTLMVAFFPFSLLFCLFFLGLQDTTLLVKALLHDFVKTIGAILTGLFFLGMVLFLFLS